MAVFAFAWLALMQVLIAGLAFGAGGDMVQAFMPTIFLAGLIAFSVALHFIGVGLQAISRMRHGKVSPIIED